MFWKINAGKRNKKKKTKASKPRCGVRQSDWQRKDYAVSGRNKPTEATAIGPVPEPILLGSAARARPLQHGRTCGLALVRVPKHGPFHGSWLAPRGVPWSGGAGDQISLRMYPSPVVLAGLAANHHWHGRTLHARAKGGRSGLGVPNRGPGEGGPAQGRGGLPLLGPEHKYGGATWPEAGRSRPPRLRYASATARGRPCVRTNVCG